MSARDELFESLTGGGWNVSSDEEDAMNRLIDDFAQEVLESTQNTGPQPNMDKRPIQVGDRVRVLRVDPDASPECRESVGRTGTVRYIDKNYPAYLVSVDNGQSHWVSRVELHMEAPVSPVKAPESDETPSPEGLDLTRALRALERDLGIPVSRITKVVLDPKTIAVSYLDSWRGQQVVNTMEVDYWIDLEA